MKNKIFRLLGIILLLFVFIALILTPMHKKAPVKKAPALRGRIAIVIDDWGYSLNNLLIIEQIKQPLTCAVLPGLKNSNPVMQKLNSLGFEIILHLPMEPKERYNLEKNTITLGVDAEEIRKIFDQDLSSVALAKGVSNHMGSRITEDKKASTLVMAETKRRKLYFFDSFVTGRSVCAAVAKQIKIKFAKRDVFLDNQDNPDYIQGQLVRLKYLARRQGTAIGIGHDRKGTLLVLKEMLPQMEKEGYKFVFLSQVVR
ncbi:MAG: divergent polysaccharide deacetylase family protein [Candidatus Omnitrophota bacterium]